MTGLIEGQWYAYRVRAFNKLGASRPCRATDEIQAVDAKGRLVCAVQCIEFKDAAVVGSGIVVIRLIT